MTLFFKASLRAYLKLGIYVYIHLGDFVLLDLKSALVEVSMMYDEYEYDDNIYY